ncbi:hypothetical protein DFH05DRAFT_1520921 [Lentinula detonsa]|uniref:Uncharacterized protein n=1 Tax=Lentinula detonsa TaxID=2804962 RepID=A0A9W8U229_9AGAR|nr:hypothetical protein DFH05DRAFT_1520921 [Lentinula detonsa]
MPRNTTPGEKHSTKKVAGDLVREIIRKSFAATSLEHISELEPVSADTLHHFRTCPEQGPTLSNAKLDTSGKNLSEIKQSPWNQALIYRIARQAESVAQNTHSRSGSKEPLQQSEWDKLVADKIYRILRKACSHKRTDDTYLAKHSRSLRDWKMTRRQTIATIEQQDCKDNGDIEGYECWGFILYAVTVFGIDGMSDEEDDEENGEKVKSVLDVGFRRPEFRTLFRSVDIRHVAKGQGGRKLQRRVEVSKMVERQLPRNIPCVFLSPGFQSSSNAIPQEAIIQLEADLAR